MLALVRSFVGWLIPDRYKIPAPCPVNLRAGCWDRFPPVLVGVAAAAQVVTGGADALALEAVFGPAFATLYLLLLVTYGLFAAVAVCVLTLGLVLRLWGATVMLLAGAALARWALAEAGAIDASVKSPVLVVAFYVGWGAVAFRQGGTLLSLGRTRR